MAEVAASARSRPAHAADVVGRERAATPCSGHRCAGILGTVPGRWLRAGRWKGSRPRAMGRRGRPARPRRRDDGGPAWSREVGRPDVHGVRHERRKDCAVGVCAVGRTAEAINRGHPSSHLRRCSWSCTCELHVGVWARGSHDRGDGLQTSTSRWRGTPSPGSRADATPEKPARPPTARSEADGQRVGVQRESCHHPRRDVREMRLDS